MSPREQLINFAARARKRAQECRDMAEKYESSAARVELIAIGPEVGSKAALEVLKRGLPEEFAS